MIIVIGIKVEGIGLTCEIACKSCCGFKFSARRICVLGHLLLFIGVLRDRRLSSLVHQYDWPYHHAIAVLYVQRHTNEIHIALIKQAIEVY